MNNCFDDTFKKILIENEIKNSNFIAYHGSSNHFLEFTDEFVGGENAKDANGFGIYFSSLMDESLGYSEGEKGVLFEVELRPRLLYDNKKITIKKSIIKKLAMMSEDWEIKSQNFDESPLKGLEKFIKSAFDRNDNDKDVLLQVGKDFYPYEPLGYVRNCVKLGIDGIMIENVSNFGNTHFVIYNPKIIKILNITDKKG